MKRAQDVPPRHDTLRGRDRHLRLSAVGTVGNDDETAGTAGGKQVAKLAERRVTADHRHARAHHSLDRRVAQAVANGVVEILP